jgi:hypothetical protein
MGAISFQEVQVHEALSAAANGIAKPADKGTSSLRAAPMEGSGAGRENVAGVEVVKKFAHGTRRCTASFRKWPEKKSAV